MASEAANGLGGHFWLQKWAQGPWWHVFLCLFSFIVPEKTFIPRRRRKEETKLTCRPACSYLAAGNKPFKCFSFWLISIRQLDVWNSCYLTPEVDCWFWWCKQTTRLSWTEASKSDQNYDSEEFLLLSGICHVWLHGIRQNGPFLLRRATAITTAPRTTHP